MTFILNILHKDMSILAADRTAIAGELNPVTPNTNAPTEGGPEVHDFPKITLNASGLLAIGIAGNTHEHYYWPEIRLSVNVSDLLSKIRRNVEFFLRKNRDRPRFLDDRDTRKSNFLLSGDCGVEIVVCPLLFAVICNPSATMTPGK